MMALAPMLLALLGTVLMAFVIFAPHAAAAATPAAVTSPGRAADACDEPRAPAAAPLAWPLLVDPRASACDVGVRLALVDALAAVGRPWAATVLVRALYEEPDAAVRAAIERELTAGSYAGGTA